MAVGKPIIGAINGSCANFIETNKIGHVCCSGDFNVLSRLIKELDVAKLRDSGLAAQKVYFEKYIKKIFINRLLSELKNVINM